MEKEKEISIDSLNIKIGGREISLSVVEAKKLKVALEELFGKEVIREHYDHWYYRQNYIPNYYPFNTYVTCNAIGSVTGGSGVTTTNCLSLDIK